MTESAAAAGPVAPSKDGDGALQVWPKVVFRKICVFIGGGRAQVSPGSQGMTSNNDERASGASAVLVKGGS